VTDTTQVADAKLEDMLRKVRALLARADHPNTPQPEAEACRDKAEELMYSYRIDEAMLALESKQGTELVPGWAKWDVCHETSEYRFYYRCILADVLAHVGIRGATTERKEEIYNDDGTFRGVSYYVVVDACGYESDLRIAELLYTACAVAFQSRLEPRYDPSLGEQVNAYLMRSAGMEGWRIAQAIYGRDDKHLRPKVRKMFKDEAIKRGEDPTPLLGKGNIMADYRRSYAEGFVNTISDRLERMRASRGGVERGLVLQSRNERIQEEFYGKYPTLRPKNPDRFAGTAWEDPRKNCDKCKRAKSGHCREHPKPKQVRLGKDRTNYAAYDRGGMAARSVDLGVGGERVGKDSTKELGS